jgi:hypothetical protein
LLQSARVASFSATGLPGVVSSGTPKGGLRMKLKFDLQLEERTLLRLILALAVRLAELFLRLRK